MTDERREEERKNITLDVRWDGGGSNQPARLADLSLGGCYVDTLGMVEIGEVISLEIKLPSGEWLPLRGTVTYQQPGLGFSLCFTFLTEDEEYQLAELINS